MSQQKLNTILLSVIAVGVITIALVLAGPAIKNSLDNVYIKATTGKSAATVQRVKDTGRPPPKSTTNPVEMGKNLLGIKSKPKPQPSLANQLDVIRKKRLERKTKEAAAKKAN